MSASNIPNNASKHARLQDFFARLVSKDFDSLAKELPPSPTQSRFSTSSVTSSRSSMSSEESMWPKTTETHRRALSAISNDSAVAVAEDHEFTFAQAMHTFESLEEMKKTAAAEIAVSQRKFQPLPVDIRPRKLSTTTSEPETRLEVPRCPKKPRVATQTNGRDVKDGTYEAIGVSDDPFARVAPRRTRGAQEALRTRKDSAVEEDVGDNLRPGSVISEALVLNFVREMHERSLYSSERDLDMAGLRPLTMFPSVRPSVPSGETRENIAMLQDRPMKRRLSGHDESSDL